jgi:predicted PurR-regulated permease PerM
LSQNTFSQKVLFTIGLIVLLFGILILFVEAVQVLLLIFAGIMLAVFLRGTAAIISERTSFSYGLSIFLVLFFTILLVVGGVWLLGPNIVDGFNMVKDQAPAAWGQIKSELSRTNWGRSLVHGINNAGENILSNKDIIDRVSGIFSSTLATIINIFIILVIGLYTAFSPGIYINGFIKLIPRSRRERVREVLDSMGLALRWWFVGRVAAMMVIGVLTSIGLAILNIPMPVTLGIFAALMTFIPNIGPIISAVPAALFGFVISPMKGVYVIFLYIIIQTLESYFVTPQIQKKAVSLPPALLISAQILIGVLLGAFGLILATPLMVCVIVAVQMLYVEDALGDTVKVLGGDHPGHK